MENIKRNVMNSVKMNRIELLKIVRENQKQHIQQFEESVADYKELVIRITKTNVKLANTGDLDEIRKIKSLPASPISHEKEYSRAIRMLELSVEDIIEVEEHVFNQLVLDEWGWKQQFTAMATSYKTL
jgi:hypothetical protein